MTFSEFGLDESILKSIDEFGFTEPTPIQAGAIPNILEGKDVIGSAQTGTGKTAAYALPILHRLGGHKKGAPPRDRKSTRLNSSHSRTSRMPSSA